MTRAIAEAAVPNRYLKVPEAARYSRMSEMTLRRLEAEGRLHFLRPKPRVVLIDRQQLDTYLAGTAKKTP
jgi:excisionase family DNA binding protein